MLSKKVCLSIYRQIKTMWQNVRISRRIQKTDTQMLISLSIFPLFFHISKLKVKSNSLRYVSRNKWFGISYFKNTALGCLGGSVS